MPKPDMASPNPGKTESSSAGNWGQDQRDCLWTLCAHRPSYIIARNSNSTNPFPHSPSPGHTATVPESSKSNELKFQISFKSLLAATQDRTWQLWGAYTQQSQWQVFDAANSSPFRDNNYEPELFLNWVRPTDRSNEWQLRTLGIGVVHQSNGQTDPLSRSWNRTYLQAGFTRDEWSALARIWHRWSEATPTDDNPDISDYIGRGELNLTWARNGKVSDHLVNLRLRHSLKSSDSRGSAQLDWFIPLPFLKSAHANLKIYLQAFNGYGESMLDYNHHQTTFGAGIGIFDWGL